MKNGKKKWEMIIKMKNEKMKRKKRKKRKIFAFAFAFALCDCVLLSLSVNFELEFQFELKFWIFNCNELKFWIFNCNELNNFFVECSNPQGSKLKVWNLTFNAQRSTLKSPTLKIKTKNKLKAKTIMTYESTNLPVNKPFGGGKQKKKKEGKISKKSLIP